MNKDNQRQKRNYRTLLGNKPIAYVYFGIKLIWSAVSSCFGSGMWLNDKPWSNDDVWKN